MNALTGLSDLGLLGRYRDVMDELKARGLVRSTAQAPLGDYAEELVRRALPGARRPTADRGVDLVQPTRAGREIRIQVKARRAAGGATPTHLPDLKGLGTTLVDDDSYFDKLAAVIFREDFTVERARLLSRSAVERLASRQGTGKFRLRIEDIAAAEPDPEIELLDLGPHQSETTSALSEQAASS